MRNRLPSLLLHTALCASLTLGVAGAAAAGPATGMPPQETNWTALTPSQRETLAPLAGEWPQLDDERRRKWLRIAQRAEQLPPDAQQRLRERMSEWARMTPQQRQTARENFQATRNLSTERKVAAWESYQNLTEEEREALAARGKPRRSTVSLPPAGPAPLPPPKAASAPR